MSSVQVLAVFWGGNVDMGEQNDAPGFYATLTNSPWMDVLAQYATVGVATVGGQSGTAQSLGRGSFVASYTITPANTNTTLSDADIQTELQSQIDAGHLPPPQYDTLGFDNTLYMIYFPLSVTISDPNIGTSCVQFCAYHGTLNYNNSNRLVAYGVIPDFTAGSGCSFGCGTGATYIDNLNSVCSHELAESVTDIGVGQAQTFAPPLAWYDQNNSMLGEVGDICNAMQGSTTTGGNTYTVQDIWSNADNACVASSSLVGNFATIDLKSSNQNARFRTLITFTAQVSGTLGTPTGSVTFFDGNQMLGTKPLATGIASWTVNGLSAGAHTITAQFNGTLYSVSLKQIVQYRSPRPH